MRGKARHGMARHGRLGEVRPVEASLGAKWPGVAGVE